MLAAERESGRFVIIREARQLLVDGLEVRLGGRGFDLLLALVDRRGSVVGKDELYELIWPGVAVEPNNLQVQIWALRRVLGADVIKTIPRRGYQFSATVEFAGYADAPARVPLGAGDSCESGAAEESPDSEASRAFGVSRVPRDFPDSGDSGRLDSRGAWIERVARLLENNRWLTLVDGDAVGRTALAEAIARERGRSAGDSVWRLDARAGEAIDRMATIDGVVLASEIDVAGRRALGAALRLARAPVRVVATAPAGVPLPGEIVIEVPHDLRAPPRPPDGAPAAGAAGRFLRWRPRPSGGPAPQR